MSLGVRRQKLLVVQTHPIQYYAPLYRILARNAHLDVLVVYLSDAGAVRHFDPGFGRDVVWDVPLLDGYRYQILQPGSAVNGRSFLSAYDRAFIPLLTAERPDWIHVSGYNTRLAWEATLTAHSIGARVLYWSDSNIRDHRPAHIRWLKKQVLRPFLNRVTYFLSPGCANRLYLRQLGVPAEKIRFVPFGIDQARFSAEPACDKTYDFVWAGKLVDWKRPADFVEALSVLERNGLLSRRSCIVGHGPLEADLRRQSIALGLEERLEFLGFVNQSDMPGVLSRASTLVMTSEREPYGLIATEAAAAGLALIVADNIGCVGMATSAQPNKNTITFRSGDVHDLEGAMRTALSDPMRLAKMQRESRRISLEHDVGTMARKIEDVVFSQGDS